MQAACPLRFFGDQDGGGFFPYHPSLRSRQAGLPAIINATFLARSHPLICFSRWMAARMSPKTSKYTRRVRLYWLVNPGISLHLCSTTRLSRLLVTPV